MRLGREQSVMQDHIEQRFMNPDATVVLNKPSLRKRFMKKLTRERVVPIISARVSCVISGINDSGSPGLPNSANNKRILANRFSLELKS